MDDGVATQRALTPQAQRALAEAEARRAEASRAEILAAETLTKEQHAKEQAKETGGPAGPEPTRYGDWERRGIASDF